MLVGPLRQTGLLVLDGLGAERAAGWAREMMPIVVSAGVAGDRQTVVTTNYSSSGGLIERFGGGQEGIRIVSRVFGLCAPVRMDGPDWRLHSMAVSDSDRADGTEARKLLVPESTVGQGSRRARRVAVPELVSADA